MENNINKYQYILLPSLPSALGSGLVIKMNFFDYKKVTNVRQRYYRYTFNSCRYTISDDKSLLATLSYHEISLCTLYNIIAFKRLCIHTNLFSIIGTQNKKYQFCNVSFNKYTNWQTIRNILDSRRYNPFIISFIHFWLLIKIIFLFNEPDITLPFKNMFILPLSMFDLTHR